MKSVAIVIAFLLVALWGGIGIAQQAATGQQGGQGILAKADSLKGTAVIDSNGRNLGKVDSVTLDLYTGKISYVVVDPGSGDKFIPVPYDMFGVKSDKRLVLNVDKNKLDAAPSYAKSSQPNWTNPQWGQQVANFWGKTPSGIMTGQASSGSTGSSQQSSTMGSGVQQSGGSTQQPMGQGAGAQSQPSAGSNLLPPVGSQAPGNQQQPMGQQGVSSQPQGPAPAD